MEDSLERQLFFASAFDGTCEQLILSFFLPAASRLFFSRVLPCRGMDDVCLFFVRES